MGAIMTNLLYFTISLTLVGLVGRALSRSGHAFLGEMFGARADVAEAVNRLLVVAFYLLSLSFIALTTQIWSHVGSAGQAMQLLSVKIGELLLVLGVLHLASTVAFARLRRARSWPAKAGPAAFSPGTAGSAGPGDLGSEDSDADSFGAGRPAAHRAAGPPDHPPGADASARVASRTLWRPRPGDVIH
ncbi:MAG TPA: hypothetical protein VHZ03_02370 [Trebonia sp.]|nr:hypothetical protein [Trebonia sp.]